MAFIDNGDALPASKSNKNPLPTGADPTQYLAASDHNAHRQALIDTQTFLRGNFKFFDSNGANPISVSNVSGTPVATATQGSLAIDRTNAILYINSDGATGWKKAGGFTYSDESLSPDADPSTANALDDEFNEASALDGRWSGVGVTDLQTTPYVMGNSSILMTKKASTNNVSGYVQSFTPGSSNWTFQTKMILSLVQCNSGGFPSAGLLLSDGTKYMQASVFFSNRNQPGFAVSVWTNRTTWQADLFTLSPAWNADPTIIVNGCCVHKPIWVRMQRSGSDIIHGWSPNGYDYVYTTAVGAVSQLGSITQVGIGAANNNSADIAPRFLHFRKIA